MQHLTLSSRYSIVVQRGAEDAAVNSGQEK